jgi:nicotinamidase-related amidase
MSTPSRTALVVGDMQAGITANFPFAGTVLPAIADVVSEARARGAEIIFLRAGLRPTGKDLGARNTIFASFFDLGHLFHDTSPDTAIDTRIGARPEDTVVLKRRTSGFAHTDLDLILRSRRIESLALCGVATSAMIAATVYAASDLDYDITVLRDLCADADPDVHEFLLDRVFPLRGVRVTNARRWLDDADSWS